MFEGSGFSMSCIELLTLVLCIGLLKLVLTFLVIQDPRCLNTFRNYIRPFPRVRKISDETFYSDFPILLFD